MAKINESKKEKLPLDFLTTTVSHSWEEIGNLKASITGIHDNFTDTKKIEEILQDLVDAYLICVGQLELYMDKKDYIDAPEELELKESLDNDLKKGQFYGSKNSNTGISIKDITGDKVDYTIYYDQDGADSDQKTGSKSDVLKIIDDKKLNLFESNEADATPVETKKFEDNNKTEIFTELPDYKVEVEQKGDKVEIELEPVKSTDNDAEETPEVTDSEEMEDTIDQIGNPIVNNTTEEPFEYFTDFDDPIPDETTDNAVRAWLNR